MEAQTAFSVTAGLGYFLPKAERPFRYMYRPPAGEPWHNCEYEVTPVRISDARAMKSRPSLEVEGFELWDAPSAVADFRDDNRVRSTCYAEAAELAIRATGADHVFVFDHALRLREAGRPALNFGRKGDGSPLGAVGYVHTDYTEPSGKRRFEITDVDPGLRTGTRRFAIVNIWRSIGGKIVDTPLALCDARTVAAADLAATELRYPDRVGEIYLVQHSPRHRWAYFPEMDRDEALVFKQYNSQLGGIARFTPHSAFDLPEIPPDAPLRESIEIRCLVIWS